MREDIKQEWVATLRSGDYRQSPGGLRDDRGYCCLGVLCDILSKKPEFSDWHWNHLPGTGGAVYGFSRGVHSSAAINGPDSSHTYIPWKLAALINWLPADPDSRDPWVRYAEANDRGDSFEQIAAMIEASE
jgi:hypothetical protein